MKYFSLCLIYLFAACNKPPATAPSTPQTTWIDMATHNDTIVTNVNMRSSLLYYAQKNWQLSADTNTSHGYRFIAVQYNDSILVKEVNDLSSDYVGPFYFYVNEKNDTLKAQNFLDSSGANPIRTFILLR